MNRRPPTTTHGNAVPFGAVFPRVCQWAGVLVFWLVLSSGASAQHLPGSVLSNTASATYATGARTGIALDSNRLALTVVPTSTGSAIEFLRFRPDVRASIAVPVAVTEFSLSGEAEGPFQALSAPVPLAGVPIDISEPVPLTTTTIFFQGDPVFMRVIDPDQNRDSQVRDSILLVLVNGDLQDREMLKLYETGPASGELALWLVTPPPQQQLDVVPHLRAGRTAVHAF